MNIIIINIIKKGGIALAAALSMANMSAAGTYSATIPLSGGYVFSTKEGCGAASGSGNFAVSTGNATVTLDTADTYATWLSKNALPNPTNTTKYSSLGFNSSSTIPETPVQWGRIHYTQFFVNTTWGFAGNLQAVFKGPDYFIVTSYPFPAILDTYSKGYLVYLYQLDGPGGPPSWEQYALAVNNPNAQATFGSGVGWDSLHSCARQIELHQ
jgi:hypothetical protein